MAHHGIMDISQEQGAGCAVIIVSYHTGPWLMECLRAVLGEATAREVVIVDNGNPPEVVAALRDMAAGERRLTLLTGHGNIGFGAACNLGAAQTSGPFLLLLNPDAILKPGSLDGAMQRLAETHRGEQAEIALYTVRIENPDGSEQRGCRRNLMTPWTCLVEVSGLHRFGFRRVNLHETPPPQELTRVECISGSFMLFPRHVFARIGGMDEDYFLHMEDVDICRRIHAAGGRICFDPAFSAIHVQGTSTAGDLFIERQKTRGGTLYFARHFGGWRNPLVAFLNLTLWLRYALIALRHIMARR